MNVLIIDVETLGLDFALHCAAWGHSVKLFRYSPRKSVRDGDGFPQIQIVDDFRPHMAWAKDGLILNTGNCAFLSDLDRYRDLGFKILSPTRQSAALEIDRKAGMDAMEAVGIKLAPYQMFDSLEAAEQAARKSDRSYVFKVMGDCADKAMTFVAHDPAEMVGWLRRKIAKGVKVPQCMLQEKIDADFEIGINGWMGPSGFLPDKYQVSFEHKPLMPGDIGPNTGEMISVSKYVEHDPLVDAFLKPLEPILRTLGHRGDFCTGAMIDKKGNPWALEHTARCGYPALFGQMATHRGDPAKWMRDLLDDKDSLRVSADVCMAVVCAQPFFPYEKSRPEDVEGNPISGLEEVLDDVHLCAVMVGKGPVMEGGKIVDRPQYQTAGEYVLVATGTGPTIDAARKRVYKTIDQIHFPNMIYRNDGGDKVEKAVPAMRKFGYAKGLE